MKGKKKCKFWSALVKVWSKIDEDGMTLNAQNPLSIAELRQFCKEEWATVPPQRCERVIASYQIA